MSTVTIPDVTLLRVGTWNASVGGSLSVTRADLEALAEAAADNDLDLPIIKIGHTDGRFPAVGEDGEPAYGQVANVRLSDDGERLLGDYINVPAELAEKLPSAYPNRSIEMRSNLSLKDAAGAVVKSFKRVLTAVALLGATPPAVKGLGHVHAAFSHGEELTGGSELIAHFRLGAPLTAEQTRQALATALGGAEVTDFTDKLVWFKRPVPDPTGAQVHWYQQEYREEGGVVSLTGEPVRVEPTPSMTFIPAPEAQQTPEPARHDTQPVPPVADRVLNAEGDDDTSERNGDMSTLADLFSALDIQVPEGEDYSTVELPDTAFEALTTAFEARAEQATENQAPAPAELAEGTVQVSEAMLSEMRDENAGLRARIDQLEAADNAQRRDQLIETALSEGRLHPSERDTWRSALDQNEEITTQLLSERAQIIPTEELGHHAATPVKEFAEARDEAMDKFENQIFGEEG